SWFDILASISISLSYCNGNIYRLNTHLYGNYLGDLTFSKFMNQSTIIMALASSYLDITPQNTPPTTPPVSTPSLLPTSAYPADSRIGARSASQSPSTLPSRFP